MRLRDLGPGTPVLLNDRPAIVVMFDRKNGWFVFDVNGIMEKVFPCEFVSGWQRVSLIEGE